VDLSAVDFLALVDLSAGCCKAEVLFLSKLYKAVFPVAFNFPL
jgi:hypothetical protein